MKLIVLAIFVVLISLDAIHISMQLDEHHDERERMHQLIIERNCSFAAIAALIGVALYDLITNLNDASAIHYSVYFVLGVMVVTKALSTLYVKRRM